MTVECTFLNGHNCLNKAVHFWRIHTVPWIKIWDWAYKHNQNNYLNLWSFRVFRSRREGGESNPHTLVQYLFEQEAYTVENFAPHGNSKRNQSYHRLLPSTQDKLKQSTESLKNPKKFLMKFIPLLVLFTTQGLWASYQGVRETSTSCSHIKHMEW